MSRCQCGWKDKAKPTLTCPYWHTLTAPEAVLSLSLPTFIPNTVEVAPWLRQ